MDNIAVKTLLDQRDKLISEKVVAVAKLDAEISQLNTFNLPMPYELGL